MAPMKLFYTPTSPFVRKVLVAAHELGLADRLETVFLRPVPTAADPALSAHNPLNKIPALVLDDGEALYDSPVIVEYLETLAGGARRLIPAEGPERFRVLRTQALCDGILDAGILVFYERSQRPRELHWPAWLDGQTQKARQGLDALERLAAGWAATADAPVDLGHVCAGVTLGWLEFRDAIGDVRAGRPHLTAWYARFRERASMRATAPHA
jgi:glutathione S-transferase